MTKTRWLAAGAALGVLALAGCGSAVATTASTPTPKASAPAVPSAPALVITISGTGPAMFVDTYVDNQETSNTSVQLPQTYTDADYDLTTLFPVVVSAQDGSGDVDATITCTITELGYVVASNTGTGPNSSAECNDESG